jgi:hypothetical protein
MSDQELAAEAFVYGYPLVFDLSEVRNFTQTGMGSLAPAHFNRFGHATQLAGPQDKFVSINNDTIYSIAQLDLSAGPLVLEVPDTDGRYYVLQFVDAWTNNFAYVGKRATGTDEATYLLTPPDWDGAVADGAVPITCPTAVATIVGRWACAGEADLPAVAALQQQLTLRPLGDSGERLHGLPAPTPGVSDEIAFFERLRTWMQAFPPGPADEEDQQRFAPLGLLDPESPYVDPPAELFAALQAGMAAGKAKLEELSRAGMTAPVNGWHVVPHIFDYNVDHLGLGTLDDPAWKIADRAKARVMRAIAARVGLWGNHGYEAVYAQVFEDGAGGKLNGAHRYTVTFTEPPPVDAFWSLTMYDTPDYLLVDNPIDRYSIGDRTPGTQSAVDGSLTLYLQHDPPTDPAERANWLPAPEGDFRPMMRLYQPGAAVFDGTYQLPPIVRTL